MRTFGDATVLILPSPHNFDHSSGVIRLTILGLVSTFGVVTVVVAVAGAAFAEFAIKIPTGFCLTSPFLLIIEFDAVAIVEAAVCRVIKLALEFCTFNICFPSSVTTI